MGIYERDYERSDSWRGSEYSGGGIQLRWPVTMVNRIVLVTVLAYLVELLFQSSQDKTNLYIEWLSLHADWWNRPWLAYQLLTTALVHAPHDVFHVVFNMLGVWMFGRELEARYGSQEFLLIYLGAILSGSVAWTLGELGMTYPGGLSPIAMGASGGTVAIVILYALLFPHRKVLFMFVIPMPMWVLGALLVFSDLRGAMGHTGSQIAFLAHLGGAAFAAAYHFQRLRLSNWLPREISMPSLKPKPRLRVHREDEAAAEPEDKLAQEVDRILDKINRQGADSLSAKEKRTLEQASREYQGRKRL